MAGVKNIHQDASVVVQWAKWLLVMLAFRYQSVALSPSYSASDPASC